MHKTPSTNALWRIISATLITFSVLNASVLGQQLNLEDMVSKMRTLQEQIRAAESKAEQDPRVQERFKESLQKSLDQVAFAKTFEPLLKAEQEMYAANSNLAAVLEERIKVFPAAVEQQNFIQLTDERRRALNFDMALAEMRLTHPDSVFVRMVENDPNFKAVNEGKEPPLVESEAQRDWLMKTPIGTVKRLMLLQIPEAQELHQQLKAWTNELHSAESDLAEAKGKMWEIKNNMRNGDDPESFKALQRRALALDEVSKARNLPEMLRFEEQKRDSKRGAVAYMTEVAAENPEVALMIQQREALERQIMAERRKMSLESGPGVRKPKNGPSRPTP